jgi:hypothetical protein
MARTDDDDDYLADVIAEARRSDNARIVSGIKRKRSPAAPSPVVPVSAKSRLAEGLSTAIGESNRGYALLRKSGWTPGQGTGKDGTGRTEPVSVDTGVSGRAGIGLVAPAQLQCKAPAAITRREDFAASSDDWRALLVQRSKAVGAQHTLRAACRQLHALSLALKDVLVASETVRHEGEEVLDRILSDPSGDVARDILSGAAAVRLPQQTGPPPPAGIHELARCERAPSADSRAVDLELKDGRAELGAPVPPPEQELSASTVTVFIQECTPDTAISPDAPAAVNDPAAVAAAYAAADPIGRLQTVLKRLRDAYCYCLFCGERFSTPEALAGACPGPSAADHD